MKLVEFVPPTPHPLWELCPQMGITDVIVKVNPDLTGLPDPWRYETLAYLVARLKSAGLTVVGLEGDPFDMSPDGWESSCSATTSWSEKAGRARAYARGVAAPRRRTFHCSQMTIASLVHKSQIQIILRTLKTLHVLHVLHG